MEVSFILMGHGQEPPPGMHALDLSRGDGLLPRFESLTPNVLSLLQQKYPAQLQPVGHRAAGTPDMQALRARLEFLGYPCARPEPFAPLMHAASLLQRGDLVLYTSDPKRHQPGTWYDFGVEHDPTPVMGTIDAVATGSWLGVLLAVFPWGKFVPGSLRRRLAGQAAHHGDVVHTSTARRGNTNEITRTRADGTTTTTSYQVWDRGVDDLLRDGAPPHWYRAKDLVGKRVLDSPAGPGHKLVRETLGPGSGPHGQAACAGRS